MDVVTQASNRDHAQDDPVNRVDCSSGDAGENPKDVVGTQLNFDDEDAENMPSQANMEAEGSTASPSKRSSYSSRSSKPRLSNAQTISQRSRAASSRVQAWSTVTHKSISTDIFIRVAGRSQFYKVVNNCNMAYHGMFQRTMGQIEDHLRRAPEDPVVTVTTVSFQVDGKWASVDSQESYDTIHEALCTQAKVRVRVENAELAENDPRAPRVAQRSTSANRQRPKAPHEEPLPGQPHEGAHRPQRRPTLCECFLDSLEGASRRYDLEIDYGDTAESVRDQLVATFSNLSSSEVFVNGTWHPVTDPESFEKHRDALIAQDRVHWRLVTPTSSVEQRPATTPSAARNESPSRGRRVPRTPSSPLRMRPSVTLERTPSRGRFARPASPVRAERGTSIERGLRTPTRVARNEEAPPTPTSLRRARGAGTLHATTASANNAARPSPCRPLAIPRQKDGDQVPAPLSLGDSDASSLNASEPSSAELATENETDTSTAAAARSPALSERAQLERATPTVESAPDWAASLRASPKPRKSKNGRRSISTGRAGAKRPNKNLTSAQSVASLGLDVSNAQAMGLSEGELFAFLQQMMGDSREEISWKLQAYREGGGFAQAEQEYQAAENNYIRLLYEMDSTKALLNFVNGRDIQRGLQELNKLHDAFKVDPNSSDLRASATKQLTCLQNAVDRAPDTLPDLCVDVVTRIKDIPSCEPSTACRKAHFLLEGSIISNCVDRLRKEMASLEQKIQNTANSLETWDKRMKAAPDYQSVMRQREEEWLEQEQAANQEALQTMRSFIPVNVNQLSYAEFDQQIREKGGFYPQELLRELKDNKLLHWVVTHPDDIKCANFLMGATSRYFTDLRQYDIVELRAILAVLPDTFELDREGSKARWRAEFLQLIKDKIARVRQKVVPGAWNPVLKKREQVALSPLGDKEMRRACYFYPTLAEMNAKIAELAERRNKLEQKKQRIQELQSQEEQLKTEYSALLDDLRNKSLPAEFRHALNDAKTELKGKQDHTRRQIRKLTAEVNATEADMAANPVDEQQLENELEALRQRIEDYDSLQTPMAIEGTFERDPTINKVERSSVSKYCPEEEALLRKKELEDALGRRAATAPSIDTAVDDSAAPTAPLSPYVAGPRKSVMETASPHVVAKLTALLGQNTPTPRAESVTREAPSTPIAALSSVDSTAPIPPVTPKSKTLQRLLEAGSQPTSASETQSAPSIASRPPSGPMNMMLAEMMAKRAAKAGGPPTAVPPPAPTHEAVPVPTRAVPPGRPPMAGMGNLLAELQARQKQMMG